MVITAAVILFFPGITAEDRFGIGIKFC